MSDIRDRYDKIKKSSGELHRELISLQECCPHDNKEGKYKSNTGNFCKELDEYWIDVKCLDCGKAYEVGSHEDGYTNFNGVVK